MLRFPRGGHQSRLRVTLRGGEIFGAYMRCSLVESHMYDKMGEGPDRQASHQNQRTAKTEIIESALAQELGRAAEWKENTKP